MTNYEKIMRETSKKDVAEALAAYFEGSCDVMLQDLNRSAADCAELFIRLAAETQRAVEG